MYFLSEKNYYVHYIKDTTAWKIQKYFQYVCRDSTTSYEQDIGKKKIGNDSVIYLTIVSRYNPTFIRDTAEHTVP